jgi:competence protein ComEC
MFKKIDTLALIIALSLIALDGFMWFTIIDGRVNAVAETREYFLDVGQGDSELVIFDGNVKVMTDAGPDNKVLDSLGKVLPQDDHYIDLAIVTHPQADHFNVYNFMLDNGYRFGAFIYNGRDDDPPAVAWNELLRKIKEENIPLITLGAGDGIRSGKNSIAILSPNAEFARSAELNDTGLVERITTPGLRTLLTADTGFAVQDALLAKNDGTAAIRANILKIAHHGSKYASDNAFLRAVDPDAAVIEVGAKNTYGHPSKETLARIASSTHATVFRTDQNGTVEIFAENGKLKVLEEKR